MSRQIHDIIELSRPFYCWHHSDRIFILSHENWIKTNIPSLSLYFPRASVLPFFPLPNNIEISSNFISSLLKECYSRESNNLIYIFRVEEEFVEQMIIPAGDDIAKIQITQIPINEFVS